MRIDSLKISIKCECKSKVFISVENDQSNVPCFTAMPAECGECRKRFFVHVQEVFPIVR